MEEVASQQKHQAAGTDQAGFGCESGVPLVLDRLSSASPCTPADVPLLGQIVLSAKL